MGKSKQERGSEAINALASNYKKFSDEELINFTNRPFQHTNKKYRVAVANEIKRRGFKN